jgi:hypothetical protein
MGKVKIPYYVVKKGYGYWQPTKAMRAAGWGPVRCGRDGPDAWAIAMARAEEWKASKKQPGPAGPPEGSLAEVFEEYRRSNQWAGKAPRTREEWDRAWTHLQPFWYLRPAEIDFRMLDMFHAGLAKRISIREAHRTVKIWRALWKVAAAMGRTMGRKDPSSGVRNTEPTPRQEVWAEGEVVRLVKHAWRRGYHGLAAIMAVGWDTQLSPVDLRKLTSAQRVAGAGFTVQRGKTGVEVNVTLGKRASAILAAWLARLDPMPQTPIFRNRSGAPYSKDTLGDDFRAIRGPGERRTLADFRRSGTVEAIRGGATAEDIGFGMGNDFARSKSLQKTYAPANFETHKKVREARNRSR